MTCASITPKSEGLSAREIRALLALREETLEQIGAADGVQEDPKRISETIDRKRRNERIRLKLCTYLNLPYVKLWGAEPTTPNGQQANGSDTVQAA